MQRIPFLILSFLLLFVGHSKLQAQKLGPLFLTMPSELLPQLPDEQRRPLIDANTLPAEVESDLGASVKLLRLEPYLELSTSAVSELTMQLLPVPGKPALILLINTVLSPFADSRLSIYSQEWQAQNLAPYFTMPTVQQFFAHRHLPQALQKAFEARPYIRIKPSEQGLGLELELDKTILSQEEQKQYQKELEQPISLSMRWQNGSYTLLAQ